MSNMHLTGVGKGRDDWQTPPALFKQIQDRYRLDYDAFASHENALLPTYSTLEGTFRKRALSAGEWPGPFNMEHEQIDTLDGLHQEWSGRRVFLNPPYSNGMLAKAASKCVGWAQEASIIVGLFPVDTSTKWFQFYVAEFATIDFLPKRVKYIDPDTGEPGKSPPGSSMVVVWRKRWEL